MTGICRGKTNTPGLQNNATAYPKGPSRGLKLCLKPLEWSFFNGRNVYKRPAIKYTQNFHKNILGDL